MATVEADFEDGVLRPTKPLLLRKGERVRLLVLRKPDPARWDLERLASISKDDIDLAEAGMDSWAQSLDELDQA